MKVRPGLPYRPTQGRTDTGRRYQRGPAGHCRRVDLRVSTGGKVGRGLSQFASMAGVGQFESGPIRIGPAPFVEDIGQVEDSLPQDGDQGSHSELVSTFLFELHGPAFMRSPRLDTILTWCR